MNVLEQAAVVLSTVSEATEVAAAVTGAVAMATRDAAQEQAVTLQAAAQKQMQVVQGGLQDTIMSQDQVVKAVEELKEVSSAAAAAAQAAAEAAKAAGVHEVSFLLPGFIANGRPVNAFNLCKVLSEWRLRSDSL